jgi:hypothetical protein
MRKITIGSITDGSALEVTSSARTFAALKEEYPEVRLKATNCNLFLKNTNAETQGKGKDIKETDLLPDTDIVIYLYVDKTNSGKEASELENYLLSLTLEEQREAREILSSVEREVDIIVEELY